MRAHIVRLNGRTLSSNGAIVVVLSMIVEGGGLGIVRLKESYQ